MSVRSYQLFPRPGRSWLAKLSFPDGSSDEIDTRKKDRIGAERRAKFILRQRIAKRRHYAREKLRRQGKVIPAELQLQQPGRRRGGVETKDATFVQNAGDAPPASSNGVHGRAPRPIDADDAAAKLRGLSASGLGSEEETPEIEILDDPPAPAGDTPPEIPPLPPPASEGPIKPDAVIPPGTPSDGEMMAEMIATAVCAGTIRGVRWVGDESTPPWEPAEPHQGSLKWLQEGLAGKLKARLGETVITDGTKIVCGFLGLVGSMIAGARRKPDTWHAPHAPEHTDEERAATPAPAPPPTPPTPAPTAPPRPRQLPSANGVSAAIGRFK